MTFPEFPQIDLCATGENIKRLREAHNIRVEDIRMYMGFDSPQAIYKWQRGECLPSIDNLMALSKLFGVSMDYILVEKGTERVLFFILKLWYFGYEKYT